MWTLACDSKESGQARDAAPASQPAAAYAGSASCAECHAEAVTEWSGSHHAKAQRELDPALDRAAFEPPREIRHGTQSSSVQTRDGRYQINTLGPDHKPANFEPVGALGVDPLWQYLIRTSDGRIQMTELAFDPARKEWFNVYGDEDRQPHEWGHWTQRGMNWNSMCATCHTTRFEKNYDPATDAYHSTHLELGVGCESCHGPMKPHVDWQRQNPGRKNDPHIRTTEWPAYFDTCLGCHSRRGDLTGRYQPGERFSDHYELILPNLSDTFYPDGQVRDENFEGGAFSLSYMHGQNIRCIDCHGAHTGELHSRSNALCLRCHENGIGSKIAIDEQAHGHHVPGTGGSFCVDCHMPRTVYMQRHLRRDHGMTTPDPLLTKEHGIPNACNRCHTGQTVDWAIEIVDKWYGQRMNRPTRNRARLLARLNQGDLTATPEVIKLLETETNEAWRAVEARFLGAAILDAGHQPAVTVALRRLLDDPSPLAQAAAIETFELSIDPGASAPETGPVHQKLHELLASPSRLVRIKAAWALRRERPWQGASASPAAKRAHADLLGMLKLDQDQPLGAFRWAQYLVDAGRPAESVSWYEKAIRWDPNSAAFRHAYAMALDGLGRPEDALIQAARAAELEPDQAAHAYALGLLYAELSQLPESRDALRAAAEREPRQPRFWYNLGLAESKLQNFEAAVTALRTAENLDPTNADYVYVRATIHFQAGQIDDAGTAASRVLQLNPEHALARELLEQLR